MLKGYRSVLRFSEPFWDSFNVSRRLQLPIHRYHSFFISYLRIPQRDVEKSFQWVFASANQWGKSCCIDPFGTETFAWVCLRHRLIVFGIRRCYHLAKTFIVFIRFRVCFAQRINWVKDVVYEALWPSTRSRWIKINIARLAPSSQEFSLMLQAEKHSHERKIGQGINSQISLISIKWR